MCLEHVFKSWYCRCGTNVQWETVPGDRTRPATQNARLPSCSCNKRSEKSYTYKVYKNVGKINKKRLIKTLAISAINPTIIYAHNESNCNTYLNVHHWYEKKPLKEKSKRHVVHAQFLNQQSDNGKVNPSQGLMDAVASGRFVKQEQWERENDQLTS